MGHTLVKGPIELQPVDASCPGFAGLEAAQTDLQGEIELWSTDPLMLILRIQSPEFWQ